MLYIVSTPIGNLSDITLRAIDILKSVDFIICEDTRKSLVLLRHYGIIGCQTQTKCHSGISQKYPESIQIKKNLSWIPHQVRDDKRGRDDKNNYSSTKRSAWRSSPPSFCEESNNKLVSFHKFSKDNHIEKIIDRLKTENGALITDAGTPGISDPGQYLIQKALKENIDVVSIPGVSALTSALSISGFDTDKFLFLGFLPRKKGRQTLLNEISQIKYPIVFYESPYRIKKTLDEIKEKIGDREVVVARELTKKFETIHRGKISEITNEIKEKGEFTIILNK